MDCSTPGFSVLHSLLEFVQTHVHWVREAIQPSSFIAPFSSCLQSFPASGSFPMGHLFASGGQSIGASASASVLPMYIQHWFPLKLACLISLLSKRLSRVSSRTTVWKHQFFNAQPALWSNFHIHTWLLEKPQFLLYGPLQAKWCLCFLICWVWHSMACNLPWSSFWISQARILEWVHHLLLQGIFLTQELNLCLLHCRWNSLPLSHL